MSFKTRRLSEGKPRKKSAVASAAPVVMRASSGWWGWYKAWKARRKEQEQNKLFARIVRKVATAAIILIVVVIALAGTVKALVAFNILTPRSILNVAGSDLPKDQYGFTNILLLGSGDRTHDGGELTDSMMVASIDPGPTKSVVIVSLPRDLYIRTEKMGQGRINTLYRDYKWWLRRNADMDDDQASLESLQELTRELGRQLGVQLHHAVKVDFTAFVQAVDTLGGIDLEVPYDLYDPEYPGPNYSYETFSIRAGPQHIDGETALKYARSRHTTSDFDRSARQQQLLQALAEKVRSEGIATSPGRISAFLKILSDHVDMTMNYGELLGGGKLADRIDRANIISVHLNNATGYSGSNPQPGGLLYNPPMAQFGGASVLLPLAVGGESVGSWRQLRAFMHVLLHSRSILLAKPQIYIYNAGAPRGAAGILAYELTRYGFPVSEAKNLTDNPRDESAKRETSTVIAKVDADKTIAEYFANLLQLKTAPLPTDIPLETLGQITIILGKDYVYTPLQALVPSDIVEDRGIVAPGSPAVASSASSKDADVAEDSEEEASSAGSKSSIQARSSRSSASSPAHRSSSAKAESEGGGSSESSISSVSSSR